MPSLQKPFLVFTFAILILSACTPPNSFNESTLTPSPSVTEEVSEVKTPTPAVSKLNVDIEALRGKQITIWYPWFGAEASLFESQVAEFNQKNEWGIVVNAQDKTNFNELFMETDAALKDSTNPDIVVALPEHAIEWQEHVVDLNTYLSDPVYGMSALEMSDFPSVVWMQDELDGKRLGMPAQRTARFILYNQSWARELGFDSPPATSADFEQQVCAANQSLKNDADPGNDLMGGWLIDTNANTSLSWMFAFGGGVQEENGYRFLAPGNIDAFKYLKVLQQKNCAWLPAGDTSTFDRFAMRQVLFSTAGLEGLADQTRAFAAAGNNDEWTILPFPGKDANAIVVYGSSFVMFESDDATQLAAWLFIRWMLSAENQVRWVQSTGLFPLRASMSDMLADYSASHPQWAEAVKLLPNGQMTPQLASWRVVRTMMEDAVSDMFDTVRHPDLTDGQVPLILKQMDETANDLNK